MEYFAYKTLSGLRFVQSIYYGTNDSLFVWWYLLIVDIVLVQIVIFKRAMIQLQ